MQGKVQTAQATWSKSVAYGAQMIRRRTNAKCFAFLRRQSKYFVFRPKSLCNRASHNPNICVSPTIFCIQPCILLALASSTPAAPRICLRHNSDTPHRLTPHSSHIPLPSLEQGDVEEEEGEVGGPHSVHTASSSSSVSHPTHPAPLVRTRPD